MKIISIKPIKIRYFLSTFHIGVVLGVLWLSGCHSAITPSEPITVMLINSVSSEVNNLDRQVKEGNRQSAENYGILLGQAGEWEKAVHVLQPLALQGDISAQLALAEILLKQGNNNAGAHWMRLLAEKGIPVAQRRLARLYASGKGVVRNDNQAFKWDMRAALQGDAEAQNNVGAAYSQGRGISTSPAKAFYWYQRAARQGNYWGQFNLAGAYLAGAGTSVNAGVAYAWYATVVEHAEGELKKIASRLQEQAKIQAIQKGRFKQASALSEDYIRCYSKGE